jgi:hypothetical protein
MYVLSGHFGSLQYPVAHLLPKISLTAKLMRMQFAVTSNKQNVHRRKRGRENDQTTTSNCKGKKKA